MTPMGLGIGLGLADGGGSVSQSPSIVFANFTLPSSTGNFSITTTDLGDRTPIGAFLWVSNGEVTDVTHNVGSEYGKHMTGMVDGTNQRACYGAIVSGTSFDTRGWSNVACLRLLSHITASFVSFDENGMTMNFTELTAMSYGKMGFVMFVVGGDAACKVGDFTNFTVATPQTIDMGFASEAIFTSSALVPSSETSYNEDYIRWGFAVNDGVPSQYVANYNRTIGNGASEVHNDLCLSGAGSDGVTASFSGDDVTMTAVGGDFSSAMPYFAFTTGGKMKLKAGDLTSPVTTPGTVTETGLGITPSIVLLLGGPNGGNWDTPYTSGYSVGFVQSGLQGSAGSFLGTGYGSTTGMWNNNLGKCTLDGVAFGEFTLDFTAVIGTAVRYPYIAFGALS